MILRTKLSIAALAIGIGAVTLPALAQNQGEMQRMPNWGMGMGQMGRGMGQGMMGHGMMGSGMMSPERGSSMMSSCAQMMQSMNNGGTGQPNSQWQHHPNTEGTPD